MKRRFSPVAICSLLAVLLLAPAGASAATEAGNQCLGNHSEEDVLIFGVSNAPGNPLSATVPTNGVVTSWKSTLPRYRPM